MSNEPLLDVSGLSVDFHTDDGIVPAVRDVSFTVGSGEIVAVVGESGSGKTVTGKAILGLLAENAETRGRIAVATRSGAADVLTSTEARRRKIRGIDVAMVFQEPSTALNPVYPVGWQIIEGLQAHGRLSRAAAREQAVGALRAVGIPDPERRIDDYPHEFSGGQKQRIVIAMALAQGANLIVADEPTTALDVTVQAEILDLLRAIRDNRSGSIILITHNMGVVADLADRVVVMYQGEVVETAPTRQLFAEPQHDYTRRLLASVPRIGDRERVPVTGERSRSEPLVIATGLDITYPGRLGKPAFRAIEGMDLEIGSGEVLGLVGESGSGKSTMARAIAGLAPTTAGSLVVLGRELRTARKRDIRADSARLGFVFQDPATSFNPLLTIGQCIAEPLIVHGRAGDYAAATAEVTELLDRVRLPASFANRFPHELSGGQRQRASLARAISLRPPLLIADEPTSALDVSVQASVLELFAELQRELGFGCLFISHDLAVVDAVADRVAVLLRGKLVEQGATPDVLQQPQHPYTRQLLESLPVPDPEIQARRRQRRQGLPVAA